MIIELRQLTCVELFQDASTWLVNSPDESLGFILADNGYDVWLANVRGTQYSSGHTSLIPNDTVLFLMRHMHFSFQTLSKPVDIELSSNGYIIILFIMCRPIGIGHGMNWLVMIFLLLPNMCTTILVREYTMQVIPW